MALLSIDRALELLLEPVSPKEEESVAVSLALGRILSAGVRAPCAYPHEANSAMDGYALAAGDGPWSVVGEAAAGKLFDRAVREHQAVRIFTGGVLPEGTDSVLIQENAHRQGEQLSSIAPLIKGQHVRAAGSDLREGDLLTAAGEPLTPSDLAALGGLGIQTVRCHRAPRVAIISTGDEVIPLGRSRQAGQVFNSNALFLEQAARQAGGAIIESLHLRDHRADVDRALDRITQQADLVLLSGGVSVGDHDHVGAALRARTDALMFYKVRMKPGKPVIAAQCGGCVVLGLPGNPASTMVSFELFARPVIRAMQGARRLHRTLYSAPCEASLPGGRQRHELLRAQLTHGRLSVHARQGSGDLSSLLGVNALVARPAHCDALPAGAPALYLALFGPDATQPPEAQWEKIA